MSCICLCFPQDRHHRNFFFFNLFIYLAVLGLRFCARAFSSCSEQGPLFIAVRGPLTLTASLVAEHRLQTRRLSSCGSRAQLCRGMWDLPRPGLEPCIGRQILNYCATREAPTHIFISLFKSEVLVGSAGVLCLASHKGEIKVLAGLCSLPEALGQHLLPDLRCQPDLTVAVVVRRSLCSCCLSAGRQWGWRLLLEVTHVPSHTFHVAPLQQQRVRFLSHF